MSADKVNGHSVEPPVAPGTVTITETLDRCFKCEQPVAPLKQWTFSGVLLCEPCYRETVKASEGAEKPRKPRKRKKPAPVVPVAPAGLVPSGEVEWKATRKSGGTRIELVTAQTWFFARAAAMAAFGCGPLDVEVRRA